MQTNHSAPPAHLSDRDLIARVHELAIAESHSTAELVAHLAELDQRKLYSDEGCSSLFAYCTEVLHLSEGAAYNRIEAARAAQRFPLVLERLAGRSVHLTAVRLLKPHLTGENHRALLDAAHHKSRREVEELVARLNPRPDAPAIVRRLPHEAAVHLPVAASELMPSPPALPLVPAPEPAAPSPMPAAPAPLRDAPAPRPVITPLAPERYRIQFTASATAHELLRQARELLRHQIPDGDPAEIFEMALGLLVKELERRRFAATRRPVHRASAATPSRVTRHIPADIKRQVWSRDDGRCAFVSAEGRRCSARGGLEFHHVEPHAGGGPATLQNVVLHCRNHNRHEAELQFRPKEYGTELVPKRVGGNSAPAP